MASPGEAETEGPSSSDVTPRLLRCHWSRLLRERHVTGLWQGAGGAFCEQPVGNRAHGLPLIMASSHTDRTPRRASAARWMRSGSTLSPPPSSALTSEPRCRLLLEGLENDPLHVGIGDRPGLARPGLVVKPVQSGCREPAPPLAHRRGTAPKAFRDVLAVLAVSRRQHDPAPQRSAWELLGRRAHRSSVSRSSSLSVNVTRAPTIATSIVVSHDGVGDHAAEFPRTKDSGQSATAGA